MPRFPQWELLEADLYAPLLAWAEDYALGVHGTRAPWAPRRQHHRRRWRRRRRRWRWRWTSRTRRRTQRQRRGGGASARCRRRPIGATCVSRHAHVAMYGACAFVISANPFASATTLRPHPQLRLGSAADDAPRSQLGLRGLERNKNKKPARLRRALGHTCSVCDGFFSCGAVSLVAGRFQASRSPRSRPQQLRRE